MNNKIFSTIFAFSVKKHFANGITGGCKGFPIR